MAGVTDKQGTGTTANTALRRFPRMNIPKLRRSLSICNDCMDAGGRTMQEQLPRRKKRRIVSYVNLSSTQKMDNKTRKLGIFFV